MKKRNLSIIAFMVTSLILASCNYVDILSKKIKSIIISQDTSAYVLGDSYFDRSNFKISAKYYDGEPAPITKDDVTFTLKSNNVSYDITKPFSVAGNYTLSVSKDDVKSNELSFRVYENIQYVSNIEVSGKNEIEEDKTIQLSLTITPSQYTVPVTYVIGDSSIVSVTRNSDTSYSVEGKTIGSTTITFRAPSSATEYFERVYSVSVVESKKVEIQQTYTDYVKNYINKTSGCPTQGSEVNLLVIPVWFSNSADFVDESKKDLMVEDIRKSFFGTTEETGWHSVSSYYEEESRGELHLSGTVRDTWYNHNATAETVCQYAADSSTDARQRNLVKNAVNDYFNKHPSDSRTKYDSDHDGYLDGVMLIYAAPNYDTYKHYTGDNLWAYCFYVLDTIRDVTNPAVNAFFWASYDFIYGSSSQATERTGSAYSHGNTSHCNLDAHTYIHEMGHMFGLEDYYDYSSYQYRKNPAAGFSMQDNNVGGHDPFSAMAAGWADPYIPTSTCDITINDFQSSHDLVLLTPEFNAYHSPFDEYLLLELYTPTELNELDSKYQYAVNYAQGPNSVGIRLWHIDARLLVNGSNSFTANAKSTSSFNTAFNNTYLHDCWRCNTCDEFYTNSQVDVTNKKCKVCGNTVVKMNGRNSFGYRVTGNLDYQRINLLQLIRQNSNTSYYALGNLSNGDLFYKNSSFDMTTYSKQFYFNNAKLNSGKNLGWSFTVTDISSSGGVYSATIHLEKS